MLDKANQENFKENLIFMQQIATDGLHATKNRLVGGGAVVKQSLTTELSDDA